MITDEDEKREGFDKLSLTQNEVIGDETNPDVSKFELTGDSMVEEMVDVVGSSPDLVLPSAVAPKKRGRKPFKALTSGEPSTSNALVDSSEKFKFTNDRAAFFKVKHKEARNTLKEMEKHAVRVIELGSQAMEGDMDSVPQLFDHYKKSIAAYNKALVDVRKALLTERKLASEIWGPNNISIYDRETGKHTILDNIIDNLLHADYSTTYEDRRFEKRPGDGTPGRKRKPQQHEKEAWSDVNDTEEAPTSEIVVADVVQNESSEGGTHIMTTRKKKVKVFLDDEDEEFE